MPPPARLGLSQGPPAQACLAGSRYPDKLPEAGRRQRAQSHRPGCSSSPGLGATSHREPWWQGTLRAALPVLRALGAAATHTVPPIPHLALSPMSGPRPSSPQPPAHTETTWRMRQAWLWREVRQVSGGGAGGQTDGRDGTSQPPLRGRSGPGVRAAGPLQEASRGGGLATTGTAVRLAG